MLGLTNCKVLSGKIGATLRNLRDIVETRVNQAFGEYRSLPVLITVWAGNDFDHANPRWEDAKGPFRQDFEDWVEYFRRLVDPTRPNAQIFYSGIVFLTPREDSTFAQYQICPASHAVRDTKRATSYIEQYFPVISTRAFVDSVSRVSTEWWSGGRDGHNGWQDHYHYKFDAAPCVTDFMKIVVRTVRFHHAQSVLTGPSCDSTLQPSRMMKCGKSAWPIWTRMRYRMGGWSSRG